jgi:hypothetical protein
VIPADPEQDGILEDIQLQVPPEDTNIPEQGGVTSDIVCPIVEGEYVP